jgi:hypothetical protein
MPVQCKYCNFLLPANPIFTCAPRTYTSPLRGLSASLSSASGSKGKRKSLHEDEGVTVSSIITSSVSSKKPRGYMHPIFLKGTGAGACAGAAKGGTQPKLYSNVIKNESA